MERLLRIKGVLDRVGFGKAYLYREIQAGRFPAPVKLSPKMATWVETEVDAWIAERIARRGVPKQRALEPAMAE
jgi:prophage regulatory protein